MIDTNIFISAGLREESRPSLAIRVAVEHHLLLKSRSTEQELFITLERPRLAPLISRDFRDWVSLLLASAELVEITESVAACRDHKDHKFLELAVNGRADVIISGDSDLLELHPFRGTPIVGPAEFLHSIDQ